MEQIKLHKINEVYFKIETEPSVLREMWERFSFEVPGAKFTPAYKMRLWSGYIHLLNMSTKMIYAGLESSIREFAKDRGYTISGSINEKYNIDDREIEYVTSKSKYTPRDYQLAGFRYALENTRAIILSPTASGKSLIIYMLYRWLLAQQKRLLIIVPKTSLVYQMKGDFEDYNSGKSLDIGIIMSGKEKINDVSCTITTWQSVYKMPKSWFANFDAVIGDECHLYKSKSLTNIMEKLENCKYRWGFTGTLSNEHVHELVLKGLFGSVYKTISTRDLMDQKHAADLILKPVIFKYNDADRKLTKKYTYNEEKDFVYSHIKRNNAVCSLALACKGNTLILFSKIDHGKMLENILNTAKHADRKIYLIYGAIDVEVREQIRSIIEKEDNAIIIASYGTYSTGVNIKNLHNVILAAASKSKILVLQSIGRGLRTSETKTSINLFDIVDDLSWKSHQNYLLKHFIARVEFYEAERFRYNISTYSL